MVEEGEKQNKILCAFSMSNAFCVVYQEGTLSDIKNYE